MDHMIWSIFCGSAEVQGGMKKNPNPYLSFLLTIRLANLLGLRGWLGRWNLTPGSSSAVLLSVVVGLISFSKFSRRLGGSSSKMD